MKIKLRLQKTARYFLYTLLAVVILTSCVCKRAGDIIMDKDGNYYELTHDNVFMGGEMYRLNKIDTVKFKVRGFNNR